MSVPAATIFARYPQLTTLRALVPDEFVERTVGMWADDFEGLFERAKARIPLARLIDVFPPELERDPIRLENFLGHWGNVSVEEVAKIALVTKWLRPRRVLEIGTYNGMTTLQIALNCPPGSKVFTLDLPPDAQTKVPLTEMDAIVARELRAKFKTSTGSYFAGRDDVRVEQLLGDSAMFDYASALDGPLDLVFIDAAHDYENKRIDSENALKFLAPGGVIFWHNYADVMNPEVTRFLYEFAGEGHRLWHLRGTLLAVYRDGRERPKSRAPGTQAVAGRDRRGEARSAALGL